MTVIRRLRSETAGLAGPLAVVAAVVATYGGLLWGRLLVAYDIVTYSLPNRVQASRAIRALHLPQWDPFRFGGVPFLANPQTAVLYPPHWPLAWLPQDRGQDVSMVFHAALAALGTYAFARLALEASRLGAFVAAIGFGLGGFVNARLGLYEQITSLAWLPWALLATDRAARAATWRASLRPAAGLAAALGLCALAGHTQYLFMISAACAGWSLVVAAPYRRVLAVAAGVVAGHGVAAVQLLPTARLASESIRAGGLPVAAADELALPPHRILASLLARHTGGHPLGEAEHWAWTAWAILGLAVLAVATAGRNRRRWTLAGMTVAGVVLAVGTATPVFRLAHDHVPLFDRFRVPARWLLLPALGLPLLGGAGLDELRARLRAGHVRGRPVAPAIAAVVALVVLGELLAANRYTPARLDRVPAGAILTTPPAARTVARMPGRILSIGGERDPTFLDRRRGLWVNTNVYDRVRSVDGYDGGLLVSKRWERALAALTRAPHFSWGTTARGNVWEPVDAVRWRRFDIAAVVSHDFPKPVGGVLPPGSRAVARAGGVEVWRTPSLGPVALDDGTVPPGLTLRRDVDRPERLDVAVPAQASGRRVVVSEAWYPGWSSRGVAVEPFDGFFISFVAPPGGGVVTLRYTTPGLQLGALLSAASVVAVVAAAVAGRRSGLSALPAAAAGT